MMAAAAVAVGASALVASSASAAPDFPDQDTFDPGTVRVGGPDRFGTAATISEFVRENTGYECIEGVTIVNGNNFPDALAAASLRNPILLTQQDALPEATLAELAELVALNEDCYYKGPIFAEDVSTAEDMSWPLPITVVGGDAVVSDEVFADLLEFGPVRRLAGPTRYETALEVAMADSNWGIESLSTQDNGHCYD
jgi:putative cell wall-binding protein